MFEPPPDATLDEVLAAIFGAATEWVGANVEAACIGVDPEGVHQVRVGVRRLRSAFALFRDLLPDESLEGLRGELRWLGGELGPARDLDVFLTGTLEPLGMTHTTLEQPLPPELALDLARGYGYVAGRFEAKPFELM